MSRDNTILVVDDSTIIREILCSQIEELGYLVMNAKDGNEALDMVSEFNFDLIILDIIMPGMDGYQVLEFLKKSESHEHIPVIMISDVEEIESIARCIELGAEDYLPKNFNTTLLKARIDASLEKKRLRDVEIAYMAKLHEDILTERHEKEKMQQELAIAHNIQQSLLPHQTPNISGIEIAAQNIPALQVGGDFYDFINVSPGYLGLVIADVSGKGVPAALFMALSRAFIRATAMENLQPDVVVTKSNVLLLEDSQSEMFVTVFYSILDTKTRTLTFSNGGHNPPLLCRRSRNTMEYLEADGIALGVVDEIEFEVKKTILEVGDILVLYTDGITEAINPKEEEFGEQRLIDLIWASVDLSAEELLQKINEEVAAFADTEPQMDDITLMIIRIVS